ncbi:hypothetical protein WJX73_003596 [Symbiochloris irregularis]|uniref:Peptidoglycan binding-like domain-containing protein n=1 Tax=Symbiochloris irregularis TaxID=706552 RepID=A0AAW1NLG6_9CHLO
MGQRVRFLAVVCKELVHSTDQTLNVSRGLKLQPTAMQQSRSLDAASGSAARSSVRPQQRRAGGWPRSCTRIRAALHQPASDFLQRNTRLGAQGLRTHDLGLDYLREGSSGKEVEELHGFLEAEGYLQPHDSAVASAPAFYSPSTAQAVAKWQRDNGVLAAEKAGDFGHLSRQAYLNVLEARAGSTGAQEWNAGNHVQLQAASPSTQAPQPQMPAYLAAGAAVVVGAWFLWQRIRQQRSSSQADLQLDTPSPLQGALQRTPTRISPFQRSTPAQASEYDYSSDESRHTQQQQRALDFDRAPAQAPGQAAAGEREYSAPWSASRVTAEASFDAQAPEAAAAAAVQGGEGDSADRAGSNLTTYLAAGSAMLMKTAASRNQNLALAKKERKGAAREGARPTVFNPSVKLPVVPVSKPTAEAAASAQSPPPSTAAASSGAPAVAAIPVSSAEGREEGESKANVVPAPRPRVIAGSIGGPAGLFAISKPTPSKSSDSNVSKGDTNTASRATGRSSDASNKAPLTAASSAPSKFMGARAGSGRSASVSPSAMHSNGASAVGNVSLFGSYNPAANAARDPPRPTS